jgi:hypothetical protein
MPDFVPDGTKRFKNYYPDHIDFIVKANKLNPLYPEKENQIDNFL